MKFNGRNVHVSPSAKIGKNVRIGDNTTIYDNVEIGDDTVICNDCHIGEPLAGYYRDEGYENPKTVIGPGSLVRSHAIVYASNIIGAGLVTGHRIILRAGNRLGAHCSLGNCCELHGDAVLGDYVRVHSDVCICEHARLDEFVWLFPGTILANTPTPPSAEQLGPHIGAFTVVTVNVVILPGVDIGRHCLIGASSVVTRDVPEFTLAVGNPARNLGDVREFKKGEDGKSHYPWPENFSRGMPWAEIGFAAWQKARVDGA